MPKLSAGILLYRRSGDGIEVLLVHPGGPFWARKDAGAWTIPKGEPASGEDPLAAARRELTEETGFTADGEFLPLEPVRQKAGKVVRAWAVAGDADPVLLRSNRFTMEWPRGSGVQQSFPEVDRADWFLLPEARRRINPAQVELLDQLERTLDPAAADQRRNP